MLSDEDRRRFDEITACLQAEEWSGAREVWSFSAGRFRTVKGRRAARVVSLLFAVLGGMGILAGWAWLLWQQAAVPQPL